MSGAVEKGFVDALKVCDWIGAEHAAEVALARSLAQELDSSYERIFAYILDDLNRRHPCVELLCNLTAHSLPERLIRRRVIGPYGRLRRCGMLKEFGETAIAAYGYVCRLHGLVILP